MPWHKSGKAAHGVAGSPKAEAERGLGGWTMKQIDEDPIPTLRLTDAVVHRRM
jgi:hypothetical protein